MKNKFFLWNLTFQKCFFIFMIGLSILILVGCNKQQSKPVEHTHNKVHVLRKEATCIQEGCIEYWYCSQCGKIFSDRDFTNEIKKKDTVIPMTDHHYVDDNEVLPTCDTYGLTSGKHCSDCQKVFVEQKPLDPIGHNYDYEHGSWKWNELESAEWMVFCKNDSKHLLSYPATITTERIEPSCTEKGKIIYTAEVQINETLVQDEKEEILLPLGHDYVLENRVWVWENDTASLQIPCRNNNEHNAIYPAQIEKNIQPATCIENGKEITTASVVIDGVTYTDQKEKPIQAFGHSFDMNHIEWIWENTTKATAQITCLHDSTHIEQYEGTITVETIPASCVTEGKTIYTATISVDGIEYTDQKTEIIAKTDHEIDYDLYSWEWNDYSSVSLKFVCVNDASHIIEFPAEIEKSIIPATCVHKGVQKYIASVSVQGRLYHNEKEVVLPIDPTAHEYDYEHPIFHWTEEFDGYQVVVEVPCKCNQDKLIYSDVTLTQTTKENTFEEEGFIEYLASVQIQEQVVQEKKTILLPIKSKASTAEEFMNLITAEAFDITLYNDLVLKAGVILSGTYCSIDLNGYSLSSESELLKIKCLKGIVKNGGLVSGLNQDLGDYALSCEESSHIILDNVNTFGGIDVKSSKVLIRNSILTATSSYAVHACETSSICIDDSTIYKNYCDTFSNSFFRIEEAAPSEIILNSNISLYTTTDAILFEEGIAPVLKQAFYPQKLESKEYLLLSLDYKCLSLTSDLTLTVQTTISAKKLFLELNSFTITTASDQLSFTINNGCLQNGNISVGTITFLDGNIDLKHMVLSCKVSGENAIIAYTDVVMKI